MDPEEFTNQLQEAHSLMKDEKYKEAIVILEKLKKIDKEGSFHYDLTHKLYQFSSNSNSLYHQQIILRTIEEISKNIECISFPSLIQMLKDKKQLDLTEDILLREIELLILRGLLEAKLGNDQLFF